MVGGYVQIGKRITGLLALVVLLTVPLLVEGPLLARGVTIEKGIEPSPARDRVETAALAADQPVRQAGVLDTAPSSVQQSPSPGFTVDLVYNAIWGVVDRGATVTVHRAVDGAYGAAEADAVGFFWTPLWQIDGEPADVADGDVLEIRVDGSLAATIPVVGITGGIDVLNDDVTGNITTVAPGTTVTVTIGLEGNQPSANAPQASTTTDAIGGFTTPFPTVDLGPLNLAAVEVTSGGGRVRGYLYPTPRVFAVIGPYWYGGYADPGQQVTITVYEGTGSTVRGSGATTADHPHGFYFGYISVPGQASTPQDGDLVAVSLDDDVELETVIADLSITDVDPTLNKVSGTAPTGETVTGRLWQASGYAQTEATAVAGVFTGDLSPADLRVRDWIRLALADAEGNETMLRGGAPYVEAEFGARRFHDCALWRVDAPGVPVTLTLTTSTEVYTRTLVSDAGAAGAAGYGCSVIPADEGYARFSAGDTLTVESPTWQGSVEIPDLSWSVDSPNDRITGQAPPGDVEVTIANWRGDAYPVGGGARQPATRDGNDYTANFSDFDVRDGGWIAIHHYDPTTHFGTQYGGATEQYQVFDATLGHEVEGIPPAAGETVTATLYAEDGTTLLAQTSDDVDSDPWRFRLNFSDPYVEPGRWITVTSASGWEAGLQVPTLTVRADADTNLIWGQGPKSLVNVKHDYDGGWDERWIPVDDYAYSKDLSYDDSIRVTYPAPNGNRVSRGQVWSQMLVAYDSNQVRGNYPAGHTMTITVTDTLGQVKATGTADTVFGGGEYMFPGFRNPVWTPQHPDLEPGDYVAFRSDDGYSSQTRIGSVVARPNIANDQLSGLLYAPWHTAVLSGQVKNFHWWGMGGLDFSAAPDGGGFSVNVQPHDIISGTILDARYFEPNHNAVQRSFTAEEPSAIGFDIGVNYTGDWVNGHCEIGHEITIWVRNDAHNLEATGEVTCKPTFAGGAGGFEGSEVTWDTPPEIDPGDWVTAKADNGEIRTVHVGTIKGDPNADTDSIEGTIKVPDLEDVLRVTCAGWGGAPEGVPRQEDLALPNDLDTYRCAWNPDTEWDLEPEQTIGVWYTEPDGDHVFAAFDIDAGGAVYLPLVVRQP